MKRLTDRRTMLLAVGAATVVAVAGPASAHSSTSISGTIEFEGGAAIPGGEVEIHIEDPTIRESAQRRIAGTRLRSDGGSRVMEFAFSSEAGSTGSSSVQIVARLERADGWLLARGSARFEINSPVHITLRTVMY